MGPARALANTPVLAGLVERFGVEKVWRVGIETLGFPPNLVPSMNDVLKVQQALEVLETQEKGS